MSKRPRPTVELGVREQVHHLAELLRIHEERPETPIELRDRTHSFRDTQISLLDRSEPTSLPTTPAVGSTEQADSDPPPESPGEPQLLKKLTNNSLKLHGSVRHQVAKQKYRRYGQERYHVNENEDTAEAGQASYLDRGRAKARELVKRKKGLGRGFDENDRVVDVLWENQRGMFFFGIPRYSSNSLLPSDPKPWQNAQFRTSPVDIRNAQVPDPSWEWAWKSWYVDMSRDVDEEGWEYSFAFKINFNWHGNHPWFHSFVRRRRWLRMRKRRDPNHHLTKEKAHELTAEYFTIHPNTVKVNSDVGSRTRNEELRKLRERVEEEPEVEKLDILDIASLIRTLKKATVDREKLVAVRRFVAAGGDELYYLSERMPDIMAFFLYQNSRRQLLTDLVSHYDEAKREQQHHQDHEHGGDETEQEHDTAVRHAENLMKAVHAAEEQVKKLEYWSDIKEMAQDGEILQAEEWREHISPTGHPNQPFASKQDASEPGNNLHQHPEHTPPKPMLPSKPSDPGESSSAPSKKSTRFYDARETLRSPTQDSSDNDLDRYTTAAESVSELGSPEFKGKGKSRRRPSRITSMDGILEDGKEEASPTKQVPDSPAEEAPDSPAKEAPDTGFGVIPPPAVTSDEDNSS